MALVDDHSARTAFKIMLERICLRFSVFDFTGKDVHISNRYHLSYNSS